MAQFHKGDRVQLKREATRIGEIISTENLTARVRWYDGKETEEATFALEFVAFNPILPRPELF